MDRQDWMNLGDDIRGIVEEAVDSHDYRKLNQNINRMISRGLEGAAGSIKAGMKGAESAFRSWDKAGEHPYRREEERAETETFSTRRPNFQVKKRASRDPALYVGTVGKKASGTALSVGGYLLAGTSLFAVFFLLLMAVVTAGFKPVILMTMGIMAPFLLLGAWMAWKGGSLLSQIRRFRRYIVGLGGKTYCDVRELASIIRKSERYVVSDLRRMIDKGWFVQGHLDKQGTCLMVSDEAYRQYCAAEKEFEERRRRQEETPKTEPGQSDEVRRIVEAGNDYVARIRRSNEAIPGEEISRKISRMETIVAKILERVREHPECVSDLHQFMDYYLPTTVKLLDAYEELDGQPVQGENIQNSKREIEKTLDTLNMAFEKLLDSLFEDTAWDVSTDITVLQNMLAQEGLAGNEGLGGRNK